MNTKKMKEFLKTVNPRNITFKTHALKRLEQRKIDRYTVISHILSPRTLLFAGKSEKYKGSIELYFELSKRFALFVAVDIGEKNIIVRTAYKYNIKKQKSLLGDKKW